MRTIISWKPSVCVMEKTGQCSMCRMKVFFFSRKERNLQSLSVAYSNKPPNKNTFHVNFVWFYDKSVCFSPCISHRSLFQGRGASLYYVTDHKAHVAYKDIYCFPKDSAIKNIMLLGDPGKKEKIKYEGKKGKEEKGSRRKKKWVKVTISSDPWPTAYAVYHRSGKRQDLRVGAAGYKQKWWALGRCGPSPSKDSHAACIETQSQNWQNQQGLWQGKCQQKPCCAGIHQAPRILLRHREEKQPDPVLMKEIGWGFWCGHIKWRFRNCF